MKKYLINHIEKYIFIQKNLMPLDELFGGGGGGSSASQKTEFESLPIVLQNKFKELECWVKSNQKQAKNNFILFWILKVPAIIFSASTGIFALLDLNIITVIMGGVSGLCILIDGVFPRGMMRNLQIRAVYEIRLLQHEMLDKYRAGDTSDDKKTKGLVNEILAYGKNESKRINNYLITSEMVNVDKDIRSAN